MSFFRKIFSFFNMRSEDKLPSFQIYDVKWEVVYLTVAISGTLGNLVASGMHHREET